MTIVMATMDLGMLCHPQRDPLMLCTLLKAL